MHLRLHTHALKPGETRRTLTDWLRRSATDSSDVPGAELIIGELLSNVMRYAPGAFDVELRWVDNVAHLTVNDEGPGVRLPIPRANAHGERGRGLHLVEALALDLRVDAGKWGRGTSVSVTLPVRRERQFAGD